MPARSMRGSRGSPTTLGAPGPAIRTQVHRRDAVFDGVKCKPTGQIPRRGILMQVLIIATLVLHVLTGVFWAGTTFTLALTVGAHADRLFRPQMGAAVLVLLTGGLLWHLAHDGTFGTAEQLLAVGALCAIAAGGVQGM